MPLRLFRSRNLTGANIMMVLSVPACSRRCPLELCTCSASWATTRSRSAGLPALHPRDGDDLVAFHGTTRHPLRRLPRRAAGFALIGISLSLFARTAVNGSYLADVLAPLLLLGLGAGVAFPSLMAVAMSDASTKDSGLPPGIVDSTTQVGGAIGLAVLATVSASRTDAL